MVSGLGLPRTYALGRGGRDYGSTVPSRAIRRGFVPRAQRGQARRQVTIPLQFLLQWDDEGDYRQLAPDLFDAFGSSWPWTCSTPSEAGRRRCTPIWAGTPVPRCSRWTTGTGSSAGT